MDEISVINEEIIKNKIYSFRGFQVMLDSDLAKLYQVDTKQLNKAVNRNIDRFPENFRFQLTEDEFDNLRFQNGTSSLVSLYESPKQHGGRRYLPYVFTEQGVAMLSAVLRSQTAVQTSIYIINTFVQMRKFISNNALIFQRLDLLEQKQFKTDEKDVYHIGASLKDLGKKWFAFSKFEMDALDILLRLEK